MLARLEEGWVYGGMLAGLLLLLLSPLLTAGWDSASVMLFLTLPIYMLHQYEEHDADRFRQFVNNELGGGHELLSRRAVFWINILGVWVLLAAALWLAREVSSGWAAIGAWLLLINALVHVLPGIALRRYNPGLATAIVLFVPLGIALLAATPATWGEQLISLVLIIGLHTGIVAIARRNLPGPV
ncbi:MAG: HXXEE domain-containing protein [Pseudomonadota bacterium]